MRNQWFPKQLAEYATAAQLEKLKIKEEDILEAGTLPVPEQIIPPESAKAEAEVLEETKPNGTSAFDAKHLDVPGKINKEVKPAELTVRMIYRKRKCGDAC